MPCANALKCRANNAYTKNTVMIPRKRHMIGTVFLSCLLLLASARRHGSNITSGYRAIADRPWQADFARTPEPVFSRLLAYDDESRGRIDAAMQQMGTAIKPNGISSQSPDRNPACSQTGMVFCSSIKKICPTAWNLRQNGFLGIFSGFSPPAA